MSNDNRIKLAFESFQGSIRPDRAVIQDWDDLPDWVRDSMRVTYLQGKLDGLSPSLAAVQVSEMAIGCLRRIAKCNIDNAQQRDLAGEDIRLTLEKIEAKGG